MSGGHRDPSHCLQLTSRLGRSVLYRPMPHNPDLRVGELGPAQGPGCERKLSQRLTVGPNCVGLQAREKVFGGPQSSEPFSLSPLELCVDPGPSLHLQEPPALHPLSLLWACGWSLPGWPPLQAAYSATHVASCDNGRQQPDQVCTEHHPA